MNKKATGSILLTLLNIILLLTVVLSEYIYFSYYPMFKWYENSGIQFLAIFIISCPIFLVLGLIYYFLGRKNIVAGLNKFLPFIALLSFAMPLLLDGSLSPILISIGTFLGLILLVISIFVLIKSFLSIINSIKNP